MLFTSPIYDSGTTANDSICSNATVINNSQIQCDLTVIQKSSNVYGYH